MYGTDLVNAKRVINTKLSKTKPNPENLTLAERILLNRRKGPQPIENSRRNSPSGSVDISEITNQNDERRTPTPEPTTNNRSPVKRQESNRSIKTIASEQPGPSNRKSSTPPLPPIKTATPRPETKAETPRQSRPQSKNKVESRRETPVLPPIARKDSRVSIRSEEGLRPPKDMREFDPNLGVGNAEYSSSPQLTESQYKKKPDAIERSQERTLADQKNETKSQSTEIKPKTPEREIAEKSQEKVKPKSPEKQMYPDKTNEVPVVTTSATSSQRQRSQSPSRHRSRGESRSRSRSRSQKHSKRQSRSPSHSRSLRRSRRSRSRKRYRSSSYSSSSSPRRGRRYSSSPIRRHRSRGRNRSRRGSFDYDFERAKSIVRSLSRMDTFSRPRHRSPSIEYQIIGGNSGFWPSARPESSKTKKKIIIVQGGGSVMQKKRRSRSSSDSDISVIVKNVKSKTRDKKEKVRRVSESDETESDSSKSRSRARKGKKKRQSKSKINDSTSDESDEEENISRKKSKNSKPKKSKQSGKKDTKKKSLRFDLRNVSSKNKLEKGTKKVTVESDNESEPEVNENVNIPKSVNPTKLLTNSVENVTPVEEKRENVAAAEFRMPTPNLPLPPERSPTQRKDMPFSLEPPRISQYKSNEPKPEQKNKQHEDNDLFKALDQLDKRTDFELEQLKGGNQRKLPPEVNLDMKRKIFSKEFQQNINNFLES